MSPPPSSPDRKKDEKESRTDPDYAQETIDLIREFPDLAGDELPAEAKDVAATMAG